MIPQSPSSSLRKGWFSSSYDPYDAYDVSHGLMRIPFFGATPTTSVATQVMMVDAPLGLQPVWKVIYPLLPAATKKKVPQQLE